MWIIEHAIITNCMFAFKLVIIVNLRIKIQKIIVTWLNPHYIYLYFNEHNGLIIYFLRITLHTFVYWMIRKCGRQLAVLITLDFVEW